MKTLLLHKENQKQESELNSKNIMPARYTMLQGDDDDEICTDNVTTQSLESTWLETLSTKAPTLSRKSLIIAIIITSLGLIFSTILLAAHVGKANREASSQQQPGTTAHGTYDGSPSHTLTLSTQPEERNPFAKNGCMGPGENNSANFILHHDVPVQRKLRRPSSFSGSIVRWQRRTNLGLIDT